MDKPDQIPYEAELLNVWWYGIESVTFRIQQRNDSRSSSLKLKVVKLHHRSLAPSDICKISSFLLVLQEC